jgi:Ca2+-binding EF-hand superfamily protein
MAAPVYCVPSFHEVPSFYAPVSAPLVTENDMRREFDFLDIDASGFIDCRDLKRLFRGLVPRSTFDILVDQESKDGKACFAEYKAVRAQTQFGPIKIPQFRK